MKKVLLSLLVAFAFLLTLGYALPISPAMVSYGTYGFTDEDTSFSCTILEELYFSYSLKYEGNAFILRPIAHLCLWKQLQNINLMETEVLQATVQNLKEIYLLDIDNVDQEEYRSIHARSFVAPIYEDNDGSYAMHISSSLSEDEIFDMLLGAIEKQRTILEDRYPKQYTYCSTIITEDTDAYNLSDIEWECLKLSMKASSKYYDR